MKRKTGFLVGTVILLPGSITLAGLLSSPED
jgi:hypothetical protein